MTDKNDTTPEMPDSEWIAERFEESIETLEEKAKNLRIGAKEREELAVKQFHKIGRLVADAELMEQEAKQLDWVIDELVKRKGFVKFTLPAIPQQQDVAGGIARGENE